MERCILRGIKRLIKTAFAREWDAIIYLYNLSGLSHELKLRFNAALFTRGKGRYRYPGLLERLGGEKLGKGAVLVPAHAEREMDALMRSYGIEPRKLYATLGRRSR